MALEKAVDRLIACASLLRDGAPADTEGNQAIVRFTVAFIYVVVLALIHTIFDSDVVASAWGPAIAYIVFSGLWLLVVGADFLQTRVRKVASIFLDHGIFAYGFLVGESGFMLVFWAPIFATIGYGLRFGSPHAVASMIIGTTLIGGAMALSPYWRPQPLVGVGVLLSLTVLPHYALALARRIENGRRVAEEKASEFARKAQTDPLTGLMNRNGFVECLALHQNEPGTGAMLYMDLDGFKAVNDRAGHAAGDQVLVDVANSLKRCLRSSDHVARLGGDEFVVIVTHLLNAEDANRLARKLIDAVERIRVADHDELRLGASVGICILPHPSIEDAKDLLIYADDLMYRAKRAGGNRYSCSFDELAESAL